MNTAVDYLIIRKTTALVTFRSPKQLNTSGRIQLGKGLVANPEDYPWLWVEPGVCGADAPVRGEAKTIPEP